MLSGFEYMPPEFIVERHTVPIPNFNECKICSRTGTSIKLDNKRVCSICRDKLQSERKQNLNVCKDPTCPISNNYDDLCIGKCDFCQGYLKCMNDDLSNHIKELRGK